MTTASIKPYREAARETLIPVTGTGFEVSIGGGPWTSVEPRARLEDWAPGIELRARASFDVVATELREQADLGDAPLIAVIRWYSRATRLRGVAGGDVVPNDEGTISAEVVIPGNLIEDRLQLELSIVRASSGPASGLGADEGASVIVTRSIELLLSGTGGRFPVELADFARIGEVGSNALWYLEWGEEELERPIDGALTLLVDHERKDLFEQLSSTRTLDLAHAEILASIEEDIVRSLITRVYLDSSLEAQREELLNDTELADSVGAIAIRLGERVVPDASPDTIAEMIRTDPSRFSAMVRDWVRRNTKRKARS